MFRCRWGETKPHPGRTHKVGCGAIAIGFYDVAYKNGRHVHLPMCGECVIDAPNHRRMRDLSTRDKENIVFYRDVERVTLIHLFGNQNTPNVVGVGAKHWVDPNTPAPVGRPLVVKQYAPRGRVLTRFTKPFIWKSHKDI